MSKHDRQYDAQCAECGRTAETLPLAARYMLTHFDPTDAPFTEGIVVKDTHAPDPTDAGTTHPEIEIAQIRRILGGIADKLLMLSATMQVDAEPDIHAYAELLDRLANDLGWKAGNWEQWLRDLEAASAAGSLAVEHLDLRPVCDRCVERKSPAEMDWLSVDGVNWWACASCRDAYARHERHERRATRTEGKGNG